VDDAGSFRRLIRMTLEFGGFEGIEAPEGTQGLEMARSRRPALILLDVLMPGIDGLTLCRQLKAEPAFSKTPIVMLSASKDQSHTAGALDAGALAFVKKPFDPKELIFLAKRLIVESQANA